jgi:hypothetical protein
MQAHPRAARGCAVLDDSSNQTVTIDVAGATHYVGYSVHFHVDQVPLTVVVDDRLA